LRPDFFGKGVEMDLQAVSPGLFELLFDFITLGFCKLFQIVRQRPSACDVQGCQLRL
jgi:hypothetical protein